MKVEDELLHVSNITTRSRLTVIDNTPQVTWSDKCSPDSRAMEFIYFFFRKEPRPRCGFAFAPAQVLIFDYSTSST